MARITPVVFEPHPIQAMFEQMCERIDLGKQLENLATTVRRGPMGIVWPDSLWSPEVVVSRLDDR